jgi:hypothetical protein
MARAQTKPPTRDILRELIVIVETTAARHATGTAAAAELAIARDMVRLMFASADLGERFVTEALSQGVETDVDRLSRACRQYELRLWLTASEFSVVK